jgi:hypothetical protein
MFSSKGITMVEQQLEVMLFIEKSYSKFSPKSHPKRRLIADCLHKVCSDFHLSIKNLFVFFFF